MFSDYGKILDLLSPAERRRLRLLVAAIVFAALFELSSLVGIMPFLAIITRPAIIDANPVLSGVYAALGFETHLAFTTAVGLVLFALVLAGVAIRIAAIFALTRFGMRRSHTIATRLLKGYFAQPYTWFLTRHTSELGKTILSEVEQTVGNSILPALRLLQAATVSGSIVLLLLAIEPAVAIGAFLLLGGAYLLVYLVVRARLSGVGGRRVEMNRARFRIVHEAMGGVKEVKFMELERAFVDRFSRATREMADLRSIEAVLSQAPRYVVEGVAFGGMIIGVLALMRSRGGEVADLAPVLGLIAISVTRLFPQLQQLYLNIAVMRANRAALDLIHREVTLYGAAELHDAVDPDPARRIHVQRSLALSEVRYAYPGAARTALDGVSLEIPRGACVGIVGGTGAGKTSVIDLILGLLRPESGAILVDGAPITDDDLRAWQRSLGYVPQQIYLSDSSVAANIAFGAPAEKIDQTAVERAARIAALHDFVVSELPEGYATKVGDRGVRLSGGQRQRIGIARALYQDPDVLILDEATSALDTLTERAVMEAVYNIGGRKTVIMIAHRLSTVRSCDFIFLLEQGKVAASGSYDDLFATSPAFRDMASAV